VLALGARLPALLLGPLGLGGGSSARLQLRSAAVRLYGIWRDDPDGRVQGCIGKLISALIPRLDELGYEDFMQGSQRVMLSELKQAAASVDTNPDGSGDWQHRRQRVNEVPDPAPIDDPGVGSASALIAVAP
jgi:hypothetical protein